MDNDPVVVTHGLALLACGSDRVAVMAGDIRDPRTIIEQLRCWPHADLDEPIGVLLTAVMHFIADNEDPWAMVALPMSALAPGSYLALSHGISDGLPPEMAAADVAPPATEYGRPHLCGKNAVTALFAGLEIVPAAEGGLAEVCPPGGWRPLAGVEPDLVPGLWAGIGRKPS
jgi:S-adenosyl methyltransferase